MHEVLVNRLGGLSLPRKSVDRLTDRPDMTLDVYGGRKTTIQYNNIVNPGLAVLNSFTTKQQTTKFSSANFQKMYSPRYIILRTERLEISELQIRGDNKDN